MNTIDTTPATTPLEDHPRWPAALDDWLGEHQAFLSQVATMPTVAERAAR
ncbi:hypothetical protein ACWCQN_22270 [Streptomyces sp. NPDC001984]